MTGLASLTWFRKPFGPGDTDGSGAKKLLGQPDLTIAELLVRETAQNSWDAAVEGGAVPEFQMRYRDISDEVRHVLTTNVFPEVHPGSDLDQALRRSGLDAVEIIDRHTRGLGGPTRNDVAVSSDQVTDYADFVLTVGAPPDHQLGGGTYGYGKTASYMASSCSTVIIWSRAKDPRSGAFVERLIASAMDATFTDASGRKFTGRQWWGLPTKNSPGERFAVDPVSGEDARRLGEALFERHFDHDETGTSLLVLAPRTVEDVESPLVALWAEAIEQNLWPKMMVDQDPERTMHVSLIDRGEPVPLGSHRDPFVRKAREDCLRAVRAAQAGEPLTNPLIQLQEIRHGSLRLTLGHLAMTKVLGTPGTSLGDNSVIYMRHKAELVVREDSLGLGTGDGRWVAVFKPVEGTDGYFAMSEPPAHDSWNPRGMTDTRAKTCVNVALRDIKSAIKEYLRPAASSAVGSEHKPTGRLAATLGGLVMSLSGSGPLARQTRPRRRRASRDGAKVKPRVDIVGNRPLPPTDSDAANNRQRLLVRVNNPNRESICVRPGRLAIAVDGQPGVDPHEVELAQWVLDGETTLNEQIVLSAGSSADAHITSPRGVAVEFTFIAEDAL